MHGKDPGLARREELTNIINNNHTPGSVYIPAVSVVNDMLKNSGIGLSQRAFESISDNLRQVNQGARPEASASLRESCVFTRDTIDLLRAGRLGQAAFTASGVVINITGSAMVFAHGDRERMSPQQRALFDEMSPFNINSA